MAIEPTISAVAALDDDLRRGMYEFIRTARRPVTRDEAAAVVGISRKLAAFHLDKLVDIGLLRADFAPAEGRRRVGRAPKVYEATETDIRVSIPERRHGLLAEILLEAVLAEDDTQDARDAASRVARERGHDLGAQERARTRPGRIGAERALTMAERILASEGFEPEREEPACLRLRNCPFHPLASRAPEFVCGINHAFVSGVLSGLEAARVSAELVPRSGECCVELRARGEEVAG
ncbi:helix-turn-helix transcriptional regulator [Monashia sp. NPDC004114]